MDTFRVDITSPRAVKARAARRLSSKPVRLMLTVLVCALTVLGLISAFTGVDVGYLAFIPAIWIMMPLLWYRYHLKKLPVVASGQDLSGIMEWRVLARLEASEPNAEQLWKALKDHNHSYFFAARYGISQQFFEQTLHTANIDMQKVWQQALAYQQANQFRTLNAACLLVAIFKNIEGSNQLLNHLRIDMKEVESGIDWVAHIKSVITSYSKRERGGGIARDWTAGYTPLLNQVGHNISRIVEGGGMLHRPIASRQAVIEQMVKVLAQTDRSNIALVGEVGVGKTTAVYALAETLVAGRQKELRYSQIFTFDASTLIAMSRQRGDLEQLILRIVGEAHHARNIILFFDEAQLFLEEGTGSVDLSNVLLPLLQSSRVRFIFAMTPQQWQRLAANNQALAGLLNYQLVAPTDEPDTFQVMEDQTMLIEGKHGVVVSYYALREAYRLADRYITEEAFPGKALKLLEQAAVKAGKGSLITSEHIQQTIELTKGVKIQQASQDESAKLLNLEQALHERMINQTSAVGAVSNALRRARAGVGNPDRPIGAFLFLGPTGVGKTQLAKALADVYFGGSDQIIRLDMNEYVDSSDLNRLLAPQTGDQGTTFLAQIRQQPFSVVLLDEIEKAHPDIINAFLQLLDEGRISDTSGRQASFRDAIIIATSNAGADKIRKYISDGQQIEQFQEHFFDELIEAGSFKPEFLNRFDEMVIFRPLTADELVQVVTLMLNDINKQLSLQKIQIELDDDAKRWLVERGNDPRLGARPMRRMVQKYVEDIVARKVLEGSAQPGSVIQLKADDFTAADA